MGTGLLVVALLCRIYLFVAPASNPLITFVQELSYPKCSGALVRGSFSLRLRNEAGEFEAKPSMIFGSERIERLVFRHDERTGGPEVVVRLNAAAGRELADFTIGAIFKTVGIYHDGVLLSAATIAGELDTATVPISGKRNEKLEVLIQRYCKD